MRHGVIGQIELLGGRPAQGLLGGRQLLLAQRAAVGGEIVVLVRTAEADMRPHQDQRRRQGFGLRLADGRGDFFGVIAVGDLHGVPAISVEALAHVFSEDQAGGAAQRNAVLVVQVDQFAELQVAGQGGSLLGDAFHQVAIAANGIGMVVDESVSGAVEARRQPVFGDGHAHAVGETLPQRAGGHFHAGRMAALGMARRLAAQPAEALQLVQRQIVAGQVQQAVEQHGAVAGGENEAIAVEPRRVLGIVLQKLIPESKSRGGKAHRHARMPGVGVLHGVGRKNANGVNAQLFDGNRSWHVIPFQKTGEIP